MALVGLTETGSHQGTERAVESCSQAGHCQAGAAGDLSGGGDGLGIIAQATSGSLHQQGQAGGAGPVGQGRPLSPGPLPGALQNLVQLSLTWLRASRRRTA